MKTILMLFFSFLLISCYGPGKARHEVPVTYNLGWWAKNPNIQLESFEVSVEENQLNLLNQKAKIRYTIKGKMKANAGWKPYIEKVHVSERFVTDDSLHRKAELVFTPVMNSKRSKKFEGGMIPFEFTNEHIVSSYQWGKNHYEFICGSFSKQFTLEQKK
ncbi:MAG: hypothetical protein Fur0041_21620 [Bacteroidia bacterium]